LVLVQIEQLNAGTDPDGLGPRFRVVFIPLELDTIMLAKQVTDRDAIVEGVPDFDSMKNGGRKIQPAIELPTNVCSDFEVLSIRRCQ
jgi:hypothetical protein